jgi:DNA-binding transcriptional ArsR family regulator
MLEEERVFKAVDALIKPSEIELWADRFGLLANRSRLTLLLCIAAAGPISVTDLTVAADMHQAMVSPTLRLLRALGAVRAIRDGRIVRYQLADDMIGQLLQKVIGN